MTGANPIAEALAAGDETTLADLLRRNQLAMLAVAGPDERPVPAVLTDSQGERALAVFSGKDTYDRWGRPDTFVFLPASEVPAVAERQGVHAVLIDPAGPCPARFTPRALQGLLDGLETGPDGEQLLTGELDVRPARGEEAEALRAAVADLASERCELYVLERIVDGRGVLMVGAFGPQLEVAAFAHALGADERVGLVDVVSLEEEQRDVIARRLPGTRVG